MEILIQTDYGADIIDEAFVSEVCEFAMNMQGLPEHAEVSVTFVDNQTMAGLNGEYRGKSGPTDVLSFECDNLDDGFPSAPEDGPASVDVYSLGDIVIAPDVAAIQAQDYSDSFNDELALLLVHGILHLCGYDHIEDDEAQVMEDRQREILSAMKASSEGRA